MDGAAIEVERQGTLATVRLVNPARRNAITVAMWQALDAHFTEMSADATLHCIVVCGSGGHFSGGADIAEFPRERDTPEHVRRYHMEVIAPALRALAQVRQITIAKIEGVCVGGGLEVAAQCDLRVCADNARFGVPIAQLGFPMAPDEMAGLLSLVGRASTLELLLEGAIWDANEARLRGLVHRVVANGALEQEVIDTIERIARGAPLAAQTNKWLSRRLATSTEPLSGLERDAAFRYADSDDHHEGVRAFLEHRKPHFRGS